MSWIEIKKLKIGDLVITNPPSVIDDNQLNKTNHIHLVIAIVKDCRHPDKDFAKNQTGVTYLVNGKLIKKYLLSTWSRYLIGRLK